MQCHTTILEKPQLQPNATNFNYYQLGLDFCLAVPIKDTISKKSEFDKFDNVIETTILFGLEAAVELQMINSTVTPQLVVFDASNTIVYQKSH